MRILSGFAAACLIAVLVLPLGCVRAHFTDVPVPGTGGSSGGSSGGRNDAAPDMQSCLSPSPADCTTQPSGLAPCDVVCQTGSCNWCVEKCGVDNQGIVACVPRETQNVANPDAICLPSNPAGASAQSDNCQPGYVCLASGPNNNCFALCRPGDSLSCPGTACTQRALGNNSAWACDPKYTVCDSRVPGSCCNPLWDRNTAPDPNDTCANTGGFCYVLTSGSSGSSKTVCEHGPGVNIPKQTCTNPRDCLYKTTCAPATGGGQCLPVCSRTIPCAVGDCNYNSTGGTGALYGYCPP